MTRTMDTRTPPETQVMPPMVRPPSAPKDGQCIGDHSKRSSKASAAGKDEYVRN